LRRFVFYILLIIVVGIAIGGVRDVSQKKSQLSQEVADSASVSIDSIKYVPLTRESLSLSDTLDNNRTSITPIIREKADLDNVVNFSAQDSLVFYNQNKAFMYGDGTVEYGEFKLNAGQIKMEMDSSMVYAEGVLDSIGDTSGYPIFQDKSGTYESKTMKYNFRNQRGYITDVITEQGEGFLQSGTTKKMEDGTFYVENARYTTCSDHDNPHFYFQLTRGRVRPKKNIVTAPAYMVLADVPLPLAVPFGFFPFSKEYSSGIIFPSFGDDYNRGFYLRDGGYYFAINDNVDLALRGELYTKGSWGLSGKSNYVKRYKFKGSFDFSYITTITGDKGSPDYSKQNNFKIAWTHQQDSKANPSLTFSAAVNFTTSGYTRTDLNSYYSSAFTENTKSSTINMTYRKPGSKWSFSTTANITQRTQDSTLAVSFPNVTVSLSQIAPFKRKRSVGGEKWFEKIKITYSGQFQNSLTANQNQFFKKNLVKDWKNAINHSIPVQASFTLFNYLNVTPSIQINDRMYFRKIKRDWDPNASAEVLDTTYGFYNVFDFSASVALTTKVYGFFKPMKFLGDKVQMIRHVLTPTVSFSASPDFGTPFWGYYGNYSYVNSQGVPQNVVYSYFQGEQFGVPSRGKSGTVSYNLANNLEMKVKSDADSTGVKKISLIENLSISQSYNFAADSLNWSNITTSVLLRLTKNFNLNLNATWDPYMYGLSQSGSPIRINKLRISHGKGIAKLSSTGTSFSYTFNNDTFRKKSSSNSDTDKKKDDNDGDDDDDDGNNFAKAANEKRKKRNNKESNNTDEDGYAPWNVPWSLTFNYSVNYGYGTFNYDKLDYNGKWTQNLSISGTLRPAQNWNFSMSASYNFDLHKISYMNCSVSRDLHCFTMTASFIPVGPYKSFNFHIAVKSSLLKDLKYDKRSSTSNGIQWY
jgi:hypothetical protein